MKTKKTLLTLSLLAAPLTQAGEVEVLHWWTSGGEAASVAVLKEMLEEQGHTWKDFAVAGGGGESAMTVLKTRAVSGNPPSAAQIVGHEIQEWGELGFLTNLDDVAGQGKWDNLLSPMIADYMKFDGGYAAVPVNVHRVNWLWANPDVFKKAGAEVPTTLDEFFAAAEKIKAAGYIPLAHGGQPWQDATVFEIVAMDVLGSDDYVKAFVDLDPKVLSGEKMVTTLEKFKQLRQYMDENITGRDWNIATSMVINGEAAMQIMGDWAKGEFTAAGKVAGKDYVCVAAPGTSDQYSHVVDSFAFFQLEGGSNQEAQKALAATIMEPKFQEVFNLNKGSIPVRNDMDLKNFDSCAVDSMKAFKATSKTGNLVPSLAHSMATTSYAQGAIFDVVTNYFNDDDADARSTAKKLAKAVQSAM